LAALLIVYLSVSSSDFKLLKYNRKTQQVIIARLYKFAALQNTAVKYRWPVRLLSSSKMTWNIVKLPLWRFQGHCEVTTLIKSFSLRWFRALDFFKEAFEMNFRGETKVERRHSRQTAEEPSSFGAGFEFNYSDDLQV